MTQKENRAKEYCFNRLVDMVESACAQRSAGRHISSESIRITNEYGNQMKEKFQEKECWDSIDYLLSVLNQNEDTPINDVVEADSIDFARLSVDFMKRD